MTTTAAVGFGSLLLRQAAIDGDGEKHEDGNTSSFNADVFDDTVTTVVRAACTIIMFRHHGSSRTGRVLARGNFPAYACARVPTAIMTVYALCVHSIHAIGREM